MSAEEPKSVTVMVMTWVRLLGAVAIVAGAGYGCSDATAPVDRSTVRAAVNMSDDLDRWEAMFVEAAAELIQSHRCPVSAIAEVGGWVRKADASGIYFTYCGSTVRERWYVQVSASGYRLYQ